MEGREKEQEPTRTILPNRRARLQLEDKGQFSIRTMLSKPHLGKKRPISNKITLLSRRAKL